MRRLRPLWVLAIVLVTNCGKTGNGNGCTQNTDCASGFCEQHPSGIDCTPDCADACCPGTCEAPSIDAGA